MRRAEHLVAGCSGPPGLKTHHIEIESMAAPKGYGGSMKASLNPSSSSMVIKKLGFGGFGSPSNSSAEASPYSFSLRGFNLKAAVGTPSFTFSLPGY